MFSIARASQVWLAVIGLFIAFVWLFKPILPPFLIGIGVAYLLDPVVNALTKRGLSRVSATGIVLVCFFAIVGTALAIAIPILGSQASDLVTKVPEYGKALNLLLNNTILPYIHSHVDNATFEKVKDSLGGASATVFTWVAGIARDVLTNSSSLLSLMSVAFIAPVVSFYLIRDWPSALSWINDNLPRKAAPVVTTLAKKIDDRIAAFFRGQGMVALSLAAFYSIGLTVVGLEFGFVIGLATGLLSFIPYVGLVIGVITATILAVVQFQTAGGVALVLAVFAAAQVLDNGFLTPKLVGERVGLHPVWVIFSVMGGGTIAGFPGVLLAVPVAAAIGVLVNYVMSRYKDSALYHDAT
jgi:predicted PurR-regulated permease PerM